MPTLRKDLRSDLEKAIKAARRVGEDGAREALAAWAVGDAKPHDHLSKDDRALRNALRARGRAAGDKRGFKTGSQGIDHLVQIVAYEHWHRMLFARFLAENHCLIEPQYQVPVSLEELEGLARDESTDPWTLAGRYASKMLPDIFRPDDSALAVVLPPETRQEMQKLLVELPAPVFTATDSLGWTYQFWQADRKEEVNASGNKIGADELPAVTQLFTEDYMVDFLLDNTLGAWWAGKHMPEVEGAKSEEEARRAAALPGCPWTYLRFIKGDDGKWTPAAGTFDGWPKTAKELTCLDPCMGSGHFVVAMFERLVALRVAEERLDEKAAIAAVIRDNLFGLEIDPRCTQIGAFNLALAAWRHVGHCPLPAMNLACSGLAPNTSEADWLALAGDDEKLQRGMERLYRLFKNAPVLGSLINPRASESDLFVAEFHELQPMLEKALEQEAGNDNREDPSSEALAKGEMAVTALGLSKAAEILADQFTLVATNVPYLGAPKQCDTLKDFCKRMFDDAKADLATVFLDRCLEFTRKNKGVAAVVIPQNWLFLGSYKKFRERLLRECSWNTLARLGPKGFQTPMWDFNIALTIIGTGTADQAHKYMGIDSTHETSPPHKAVSLRGDGQVFISQSSQISNPDSRVGLHEGSSLPLLSEYAESYWGLGSGDGERFCCRFWEIPKKDADWEFLQVTFGANGSDQGKSDVVFWQNANGQLYQLAEDSRAKLKNIWQRGRQAWSKRGVVISQMARLPAEAYYGEIFQNGVAAIIPKNPDHLPAIISFCSDPSFLAEVRKIDQKLAVTNATLIKVPFDLVHWQKVAAERHSEGLPIPFSSNPTQWLFNGHPAEADQPLHVALARLLAYRWPRQTGSSFPDCPTLDADGLEEFSDEDGIVCLSPLRGERSAADRLRTLLSAAVSDYDEHGLLGETGGNTRTLEDWLVREAFEQHCKRFHHRPFIWHIWDGRPDGFHAFVNYHQLAAPNGEGRKLLETLIYSYLGDWIRQQQDAANREVPGAEDRVIAAQFLEGELKAILAGEPPYDLFVRWKPLHQQPIGWEPDINDGVRLNIRPFLMAKDVARKGAGILRFKLNVKWTKDRGKEPMRAKTDFPWFWGWDETTQDFAGGDTFDGNRWNDSHYTTGAKRAARERNDSELS